MYVKIFGSILHSSIWDEDSDTCKLWITMLAMADPGGVVHASLGGLAHEARLTRGVCERCLGVLEGPDLDSKNQDWGGRRAERVDGGWVILNYEKYREIRTAEQLRAAARQRNHRGKVCDTSQNTVTPCDTSQQSEAESYSETIKRSVGSTKPTPPASGNTAKVLDHYRATHPRRKIGDQKQQKLVAKALALGFSVDDLCKAITANATDPWHRDRRKHELGYVLRDADKISGFLDMYDQQDAPATDEFGRLL